MPDLPDNDMDKLQSIAEAEPHASISPGHNTTDTSSSNSVTARDQAQSNVSQYLKNKGQEWNMASERKGPLTLLDLPVDILRLIIKEITHTNDLTSLALTNSTLHNLAVPHIYARFDIVWPDGHVATSESKSVDALTYGLSTLCLGSPFARTIRRLHDPDAPSLSKFKGNEYAKYTRKFSLGNGPAEWIAEYSMSKESGKMLGTLVALAVAKMGSLETFAWDMPTGVLSDIFMALGSLPEQNESNTCNLERVWIRWHDNSDSSPISSNTAPVAGASSAVPVGSQLTPVGILLPSPNAHPAPRPPVSYAGHHVEYPTFSVLPPLKSLTVLEIDELAYLDEMADLIARSANLLQELRVGISAKAAHKDFVQAWDGSNLQQVDHAARWPGESKIGERRLGGVLGVLVGKIYDIKRRVSAKDRDKASSDVPSFSEMPPLSDAPLAQEATDIVPGSDSVETTMDNTPPVTRGKQAATSKLGRSGKPNVSVITGRKRLEGKLKLQTLELERIPLSLHVCRHAIDWTVLSNLTLLGCHQHENLWKMLRKQYEPTPIGSGYGISASSKPGGPNSPLQYHLQLKRIHTDTTSLALISFIKETLAPNSLEVLFLQDLRRGSGGSPQVSMEAIFKGALKRHRSSLRKLLLDSSHPPVVQNNVPIENTRWQNWIPTPDIMMYITSGRMSNLRELAVCMDYKEWHTFLQRLLNLPQLRSLNIPHLAHQPAGNLDPKELAMQITDIITLRPEIQLCYVGLLAKCFEILETGNDKGSTGGHNGTDGDGGSGNGSNGTSHISVNGATDVAADATDFANAGEEETSEDEPEEEDDQDDEEEDTEEDGEDGVDDDAPTSPTDPDETQSEHSVGDDSDDDSFIEEQASQVRLRLREILFYDDKVAIFRARHGKL